MLRGTLNGVVLAREGKGKGEKKIYIKRGEEDIRRRKKEGNEEEDEEEDNDLGDRKEPAILHMVKINKK